MDALNSLLISDLHFEHVQWLNELRFWEGELESFNNRLTETITKEISQEAKAQIEHFHNKFILHEKAIDLIKNEVKKHEFLLAQILSEDKAKMSENTIECHADIRDKMTTQRVMYTELKNQYYTFLTRTLHDLKNQ